MKNSAWAAMVLALTCFGCFGQDEAAYWQGYVEGEYVHVSSPIGGEVQKLAVARGDAVALGDELFALERGFEKAGLDEARENLRQAENKLADLNKGSRPSELAAIVARLREARASVALANVEYARREKLFAEQTISTEERDRSKTEYDTARQQVRRIEAELATARLGGREDAVGAAEAEVRAALARLEKARWNYEQKVRTAPMAAVVFDVIREPGEWAGAGAPVVSLLPPDGRIVRFFVPETEVAFVAPGTRILVRADGWAEQVECRVSHVWHEAEYTPPVIYSSQTRAGLVFRVDAEPAKAARAAELLMPGLPVQVTMVAEGRSP